LFCLTGEQASHAFYRAPDEQLDQSAAYKLMTPILAKASYLMHPSTARRAAAHDHAVIAKWAQ